MKNKGVIMNELRKNYKSRIYQTGKIYITRLCKTFKQLI